MLVCGPGYCRCPPRFAAIALCSVTAGAEPEVLEIRCQWVGSLGDSDDCDRELWSIGVHRGEDSL